MRKLLSDLSADLRAKARWCYEREDLPAMLKTLATDGTTSMVLYRLMQASRRAHLSPLERDELLDHTYALAKTDRRLARAETAALEQIRQIVLAM